MYALEGWVSHKQLQSEYHVLCAYVGVGLNSTTFQFQLTLFERGCYIWTCFAIHVLTWLQTMLLEFANRVCKTMNALCSLQYVRLKKRSAFVKVYLVPKSRTTLYRYPATCRSYKVYTTENLLFTYLGDSRTDMDEGMQTKWSVLVGPSWIYLVVNSKIAPSYLRPSLTWPSKCRFFSCILIGCGNQVHRTI